MFGHQDDDSQQTQVADDGTSQSTISNDAAATTDTTSLDSSYITTPAPELPAPDAPLETTATDSYMASATPPSAPDLVEPVAPSMPDPMQTPTPTEDTATSTVTAPSIGQDDLLDIKQKALQELSPLVGHLDQSPEEKFRTTMMMIQAADNQSLVKDAYEAAGQITDEKTRAQALLDIVNEINYFTQHQNN